MAINVLGPVTVAAGLREEGPTRLAPRDRVVLGVLVVRLGEEVGPDTFADALWRGSPPASATKVVQGSILRLRRLLGNDTITTGRGGYRLGVPGHDVDAHRFEQLLQRAGEQLALGEPDRAAFTVDEALGLWRSGALPELEEWEPGRAEADRLAELRLQGQELLLEARIASGHHQDVIAEARMRVAEQPLRESRWQLLARAQYQSGLQADALTTLRQARERLLDELGLDPGRALVELEEAILRQDPQLAVDKAPAESVQPPYPGLVPYDVHDAASFFGRDREIEECLALWSVRGVLAVVGPSGSGKSSLARAGVAARLRERGHTVVVMTPGERPHDALRAALSGARSRDDIVLLVDQAEELVTLCDDEDQRRAFVSALVEAAPTRRPLLTLAADRLGELAAYPELIRLLEPGLFLITRLEEDALREVVERPARLAGLLLEPGLVDVLLRDVAEQPGALPLLSHALRQTWERREGRTLTVAGYEATGGIRGAVAQSAERVFHDCSDEQQSALHDLLLRLVTPSPDREPVLKRVAGEVVAPDSERQRIVERLVRARLLTRDRGLVEIAHASMVRAWPRLRGWLADDLQGQLVWHHLTDSSLAWDQAGRPADELYRGARLAAVSGWHSRTRPSLTPVEQAFLEESRRTHEQAERRLAEEAALARRSVRRLRVLVAAVVVAALVATFFGGYATRQAQRADTEALRARAQELAASSTQALDQDPGLARTLAIASATAAPGTVSLQTSGALHQAAAADQVVTRLSFPHAVGRLTADIHPAGDQVAMTSEWPDAGSRDVDVAWVDGRAARTISLPPTAEAASAIFASALFTPDGSELAVGVLWNPEHRGRIGPSPRGPAPDDLVGVQIFDTESLELIEVVDVGPCGGGLFGATATHVVVYTTRDRQCHWELGAGRDLVLVDRRTGKRTLLSEGITNLGGAARLSDDGRFAVHEDRSNGIREIVVRDLTSGEEVARWSGDVLRAVSPDGSWVLQGLTGWVAHEVATGTEVPFGGETGFGFNADFSPDGSSLTTVSEDGTVDRWDHTSGELLASHRGLRQGTVSAAAGGLLAVADAAEIRVTVLDLDRGEAGPRTRLCEHDASSSTDMVVVGTELHTSFRCEGDDVHSHFTTDLAQAESTRTPAGRVVSSNDGFQWLETVQPPPAGAPEEVVSQVVLEVRDPPSATDAVALGGLCTLMWVVTGPVDDGCADLPEQPFFLDPCDVAFSADGALVAAVACPGQAGLAVWETRTGALRHASTVADPETGGVPTHVIFTPDGSELLVSTESSHVVALGVDDWQVVRRSTAPIANEAGWMPVLGFTGEGDLVAVSQVDAPSGGSDASLNVLDAVSLTPKRTRVALHEGTVRDAELSPDASRVATAGSQGLVRVWDTGSLELVHEIPVGPPVLALAWLDDVRLVILRQDGVLDTVTTDPSQLLAASRPPLSRPLTTAECRRFAFDPCPALGQLRSDATTSTLDGTYVMARDAEDLTREMVAGFEADLGTALDPPSVEELTVIPQDLLAAAPGMRLDLDQGTFRIERDLPEDPAVEGAEPFCEGTYTLAGDRIRLEGERGTWCYAGTYLDAAFTLADGDLTLRADGLRAPWWERYLWGDQVLLRTG